MGLLDKIGRKLTAKGTLKAWEFFAGDGNAVEVAPHQTNSEPEVFIRDLDRRDLKIAHISDLHFGAHDDKLQRRLLEALRRFKPDLTIASGDIVEKPTDDNLQAARSFLDDLGKIGEFFLVPGNHDRHGEIDLNA